MFSKVGTLWDYSILYRSITFFLDVSPYFYFLCLITAYLECFYKNGCPDSVWLTKCWKSLYRYGKLFPNLTTFAKKFFISVSKKKKNLSRWHALFSYLTITALSSI